MKRKSSEPARFQDRDAPARPANRALDRFQQDRDHQVAATLACPWWCEDASGHPYRRGNSSAVHRQHELALGAVASADDSELIVLITADEFGDDHRIEVLPPLIMIRTDIDGHLSRVRLNVFQAGQVSDLLAIAALRLSKIEAAS